MPKIKPAIFFIGILVIFFPSLAFAELKVGSTCANRSDTACLFEDGKNKDFLVCGIDDDAWEVCKKMDRKYRDVVDRCEDEAYKVCKAKNSACASFDIAHYWSYTECKNKDTFFQEAGETIKKCEDEVLTNPIWQKNTCEGELVCYNWCEGGERCINSKNPKRIAQTVCDYSEVPDNSLSSYTDYAPARTLEFEPLTCDISTIGKKSGRIIAAASVSFVTTSPQKTFIPPFISFVSAATDEPFGEIGELQKEAAYLQQQLAETSNSFRKSMAIEDYLLEQYKIAPQNEKAALQNEMTEAYDDRKAFQNAFYEARIKYEKSAEKLAKAEEKESQEKRGQEEKRFVDRLIENTERWEKEREDVAVRLKQSTEYMQFQKNKQDGAIPQDICFNNGDCKAGDKREEEFGCAYLSLAGKPVFYKHNPYALSDDDLSGMNSIFSYVGLTSFGAGFVMEPSKKIVIKFIVGTVFEHFAGYPLPLDEGVIFDVATNMGQKAFAEIGKLQSKLELVYKIEIPVIITETEVKETYTSKGDGACHAVEWDKETVPSSGNKVTEIVTFACNAVANRTISSREDYDDVFSFGNTAETEAIRTHCLPSENPQVFAESLKQMSAEALRIVRDRNNITNSDQCPKQKL